VRFKEEIQAYIKKLSPNGRRDVEKGHPL